MRSTPIVLVLALLLLSSIDASALSQRAKQSKASPRAAGPATTFSQTCAWLKERLESIGTVRFKSQSTSFDTYDEFTYEEVTVEGQTLMIRTRESSTTYATSSAIELKDRVILQSWIPLGDIDLRSITVRETGGRVRLEIETLDGKKSIRGHMVFTPQDGPPTEAEAFEKAAILFFDNREIAERVGKAITQAAKLSGAKAGPF